MYVLYSYCIIMLCFCIFELRTVGGGERRQRIMLSSLSNSFVLFLTHAHDIRWRENGFQSHLFVCTMGMTPSSLLACMGLTETALRTPRCSLYM